MDKGAEARLNPFVAAARAAMRYSLGFRADTRMDEIIFSDGTVVKELPNGVFVGVRRGAGGGPDDPHLRWVS